MPILPALPCAAFVLGAVLAMSQPLLAADKAAAPSSETAVANEGPGHGKINTPDPSPVEPGHYKVESTYAYSASTRAWDNKGDEQAVSFSSKHAAKLSLKAGIVDNVDVIVVTRYAWLRDNGNDFNKDGIRGPITGDNFGDLDISGRYRFLHTQESALDVAYIGGLTIPLGTHGNAQELGTGQKYWSFNQTLVASKDWSLWTGNAALGFAVPFGAKKENDRGELKADLAGGYQILPWLQPELELNYNRNFLALGHDPESLAVTAGFVMPVTSSLRIKTGVQQSVWGRNTDKTTTVALAVQVAF